MYYKGARRFSLRHSFDVGRTAVTSQDAQIYITIISSVCVANSEAASTPAKTKGLVSSDAVFYKAVFSYLYKYKHPCICVSQGQNGSLPSLSLCHCSVIYFSTNFSTIYSGGHISPSRPWLLIFIHSHSWGISITFRVTRAHGTCISITSQTALVRPLVMWELESFKHNNAFSSEATKVSPSVTTMDSVWLEHMCASHEIIFSRYVGDMGDIIAGWDLTHAVSKFGRKICRFHCRGTNCTKKLDVTWQKRFLSRHGYFAWKISEAIFKVLFGFCQNLLLGGCVTVLG